VHVVDTLILPLLFSVFLFALIYLGWRDIQTERRRGGDGRKARELGSGKNHEGHEEHEGGRQKE